MIAGWLSPLDNRVYGLEDYAALDRVVPEPVLRAMARKHEMDKRHSGSNITITSGLGCPRKMLVSRMMPITPDPSKMWKMQRGTWLHECVGLSLGENPDWWTEETAEEKCVYEGTLFDVPMSCKIDALKRDYSVLMDWKFRADGAEKWVDPAGRAREEDAAQLNMARLLIEQVTGRDLSDMKMYVWVMAGQTLRTEAPYMSEAHLGEIRPGGGEYTVREIFTMLHAAMEAWKEEAREYGDDLDKVPVDVKKNIVGVLPMVGEKMYANKRNSSMNMCTRYCEVQPECYECSGGL